MASSVSGKLAFGGGALAIAFVYFIFDPAAAGFFPRCPLVVATGLQCAGCGSQRAVHALLHGDIAAAWSYNPLLVIAIPYVAVGYLAERRATYSDAWARFRKTGYGRPAIVLVSIAVVAFTVGRNL